MRLLQRNPGGDYSLTDDLPADKAPPYAILSHTWGPDEVIFADLKKPTAEWQLKGGYRKIEFCAEQAERHGLRHFWVDTCCIDKSNSIELQTAINSMFRWYRDAARCYVYLADVSKSGMSVGGGSSSWEPAFRASRWFSRGWTLQELIAPKLVEFYSQEGAFLGDKSSLESTIRDVTDIPVTALRGAVLSEFTVAERESWVRNRETKYEEDMAYSLLGIFNVFLPLIYGEGKAEAQRRLRDEVQKAAKGSPTNNFCITFSLSDAPETQHFVARMDELGQMRSALGSDGSRRTVVLHGLGGIGKTQLAVAYLKRHRDEYSAIFWMNIKDETSVKQSFVKVSKQILQQYPGARCLDKLGSESDPNGAVEAVKAWLSLPGNTRWLIVFDNYDDAKLSDEENPTGVDLRQYLPSAHQGAVIITTRLSSIDMGHSIRVQKMDSVEDSLEILSSTSSRPNLHEDPDVQKLIDTLDGLPLALASAGAYLKRVSMSVASYLRHYHQSWPKLHGSTPNLGSYKDKTLCTTWLMSYQQVEKQNPLAAHLLRWWAYFDNQDIWFELISHKIKDSPSWFYELGDELAFNDAMGTLHDYGLVEICSRSTNAIGSQGYSIHSCLHAWTTHVLNNEADADLRCLAVNCVAYCAPSKSQAQFWLLERRLLPHVKASCATIEWRDKNLDWAFSNLAVLYVDQDMLIEAEDLQLRALAENERVCGRDHESSLELLDALGCTYGSQGRLKDSERVLLQVVEGKEKVFGPKHPSTLRTLGSLASTLLRGNKTAETEAVYRRLLAAKKERGEIHTSSGISLLHNIAALTGERGELKEAAELFQMVLQWQDRELGASHPTTITTRNNLQRIYVLQGKFQEAECLALPALEDTVKLWGPKSTKTLLALSELGIIHKGLGKLDLAEQMHLLALRGMEEALGANHPEMFKILGNLGNVYVAQGRLEEAEDFCQRALTGNTNVLGLEHPATLFAMQTLGDLYLKQGKAREGEEILQRALKGREKALGAQHTSTLLTLGQLARLYLGQDRITEAEDAFLRELSGYEKVFGSGDYRTLFAVAHLGLVHGKKGELQEAEDMLRRAAEGAEANYGEESSVLVFPTDNLARLCRDQGRLDEAETLYRRVVRCSEKSYGSEHESTLEAFGDLADVHMRQKRFDEAEKMFGAALGGYEQTLTEEARAKNRNAVKAATGMCHCLWEQGRLEEAKSRFEGLRDSLAGFYEPTDGEVSSLEASLRELELAMQGSEKEGGDVGSRAVDRRGGGRKWRKSLSGLFAFRNK
ncbi:hypothetical protein NLG97_g6245 [Lecanicillium saksenae]|uniref:Uncharacterized protein n=1 Tax=Lecanicillium saksenae TaxID=468837 RepID=A0ACC1QQ64_9HYPO|nr:hypothetical protein NLG97_g6245 [Lecanicillium saksenae]